MMMQAIGGNHRHLLACLCKYEKESCESHGNIITKNSNERISWIWWLTDNEKSGFFRNSCFHKLNAYQCKCMGAKNWNIDLENLQFRLWLVMVSVPRRDLNATKNLRGWCPDTCHVDSERHAWRHLSGMGRVMSVFVTGTDLHGEQVQTHHNA